MAESVGQERSFQQAKEPMCRLFPLMEALAAGQHPPIDCLGMIACNKCLGVFDVSIEIDGKVDIANHGHISCKDGLSNHDGHHLEA